VTGLIDEVRLNFLLIRARAAALGLPDAAVADLIGVRLRELETDLDHRLVTLTVLVRLSRILAVSLDDLVLTDSPAAAAPPVGEVGDEAVILALTASYAGVSISRVLTVLGWSRARLSTAVDTVVAQLEPTPLRLIVTDTRLALALRDDALPEGTHERLDAEFRHRQPLHPHTATDLVKLIINGILAPFPADIDDPQQLNKQAAINLIVAGLAATTRPDGPYRPDAIAPHPDVMFALGLADAPAADDGPVDVLPHWTLLL
jgi:hypothetical protein